MASEYQLLNDPMTGKPSGTVLRRADNAYIPDDGGNRDRQIYVEWCEAGGVADPPEPLPERAQEPQALPMKRLEELEARVAAIEQKIR